MWKAYLAIEVLGNLLERSVAGLDVEEVDNDELDSDPDVVDNVVLPGDVLERNRVDVLVEEEGDVNHQEHGGHTLGAEAVRQNLSGVTDEKTRPGHVVEDVVDEDHGHNGTAGTAVSVDGVTGGADGPDDEGSQHTSGGNQEERATADLVNNEALASSDDDVQDLQATVDDELDVAVRDPYAVEDDVEVVRDKTVAGPLGEETEGEQDEEPVAVTLGLDELAPAVALEFLLELDGVLDLLELDLHDLIVEVAVGVNLGEGLVSLLNLAVGNHPARRLGDEPDEAQLQEGRKSLDKGRHAPCPVVVDVVSTESQPGSDEGTDVPGRVVDGSERCTVLRVNELGDQQRRGAVGDGNTESKEESGGNEHLQVDRDRLENHTEDHNDTANADTGTAAKDVSGVRDERDSDEGTDGPARRISHHE